MTKLVVVFTATGLQGQPIVKYLLQNANDAFRVRALTRDATKPASKELAELGAQVVEINLDDDDSVRNAVSGANVIFANTDFWSVYTVEAEVAQAAKILQAADELPDLEHFVQSSFPDPKSSGFNNILHYNAKNEIKRLSMEKYPQLSAKTTNVWVGYYFENWIKFNFPFGPQKVSDGVFELPVPFSSSTRIACTSPGDLGIVFHAIIDGGETYHKKTVSLFTTEIPESERLEIWANALGVKAAFKEVIPEEYTARMETAMPPPIALNVTEQLLIIGTRGNYLNDENVVKGTDIVEKSYKFKTWFEYVKEADWSGIS